MLIYLSKHTHLWGASDEQQVLDDPPHRNRMSLVFFSLSLSLSVAATASSPCLAAQLTDKSITDWNSSANTNGIKWSEPNIYTKSSCELYHRQRQRVGLRASIHPSHDPSVYSQIGCELNALSAAVNVFCVFYFLISFVNGFFFVVVLSLSLFLILLCFALPGTPRSGSFIRIPERTMKFKLIHLIVSSSSLGRVDVICGKRHYVFVCLIRRNAVLSK